MRYLGLLILPIFALFYWACGSVDDLIPTPRPVDSKITEDEANAQDYNLRTLGYEMRVAIRSDVDGNTQDILNILDNRAAEFLECQFMMDPQIGDQGFQIPSGKTVPPLSRLRVFVVPFNFECDAVDKDVCAGIFFPSSDLIIIAKESLAECGELPLWKHELGHRYGMASDHTNQSEFEPCIDPPECGLDDLIGIGIGG